MSLLDSIGKGFRFFLMSMGVSTYAKKPPAATKSPAEVPKAPPAKQE